MRDTDKKERSALKEGGPYSGYFNATEVKERRVIMAELAFFRENGIAPRMHGNTKQCQ